MAASAVTLSIGGDDFDDGVCEGTSVRVTEDSEMLVYPESRYTTGQSPMPIYLPTNELLLAMMRACIHVESPDQLWINKLGWE